MKNNGFPNLTLSYVNCISRDDIKHKNNDGTFWIATRMYFKNEQGITLLTVSLLGNETAPEFETLPMRDSVLDRQS